MSDSCLSMFSKVLSGTAFVLLIACVVACSSERNPNCTSCQCPTPPCDPVLGPDAAPRPDANVDGTNAVLDGRVCVIRDFLDPFECASEVDRLNVAVSALGSTEMQQTDTAGLFSMNVSPGQVLQVGESDARFYDTLFTVPATLPSVDVPVVGANAYTTFTDANGIVEGAGEASIALYILDSLGAASGAQVAVSARFATFYDKDGPGDFDMNALSTGSDGAALIFGVLVDGPTTRVVVTGQGGAPVKTIDVPVAEGHMTVVRVQL